MICDRCGGPVRHRMTKLGEDSVLCRHCRSKIEPAPHPVIRESRSKDYTKSVGVTFKPTVLGIYNPIVAGDIIQKSITRRAEIMDQHGAPKVLAKGGRWLVPKDKRPKGWETMGLREPIKPIKAR